MEIVLKQIEQSAATILFCLAMFILLLGLGESQILIAKTQRLISRQNIVYEQENDYEMLVTYEEIISMLMGQLIYDIRIGGYSIECDGYHVQQINLQLIENKDYRRTYIYDGSGNITYVLYN